MPCGRRKEIKKTLRTRDKSAAKRKVLELLACVRSGSKTRPDNPLPSSVLEQTRLQASGPIVVPSQPESQMPARACLNAYSRHSEWGEHSVAYAARLPFAARLQFEPQIFLHLIDEGFRDAVFLCQRGPR